MIRSIILAIGWLLFAASAFAHKPSDSYLTIKADTQQLQGQWDIALRDLDYAIGLDANLDGNVEWGEVKAKHAEIVAYAFSHLKLTADGSPCPSRVTDHKIDNHSDGAYAVVFFAADCPKTPLSLEIDYTLCVSRHVDVSIMSFICLVFLVRNVNCDSAGFFFRSSVDLVISSVFCLPLSAKHFSDSCSKVVLPWST